MRFLVLTDGQDPDVSDSWQWLTLDQLRQLLDALNESQRPWEFFPLSSVTLGAVEL